MSVSAFHHFDNRHPANARNDDYMMQIQNTCLFCDCLRKQRKPECKKCNSGKIYILLLSKLESDKKVSNFQ